MLSLNCKTETETESQCNCNFIAETAVTSPSIFLNQCFFLFDGRKGRNFVFKTLFIVNVK